MNKPTSHQLNHILVVEDDPISRTLLQKILVHKGYEVTAVENGQQALTLYSTRFFPLVITDWVMPKVNGLELCRSIRERPLEGYVYILLLTAKNSRKDIIEGLESGADDYLTKPINEAELSARIKTGQRVIELETSLRKANEEIRLLSRKDHLTGCFNRRFLDDRLSKEIKRSKRYNHSLAVILVDLDHFKTVNDTYGHQTGDQVIKQFAAAIQKSIRNDIDWVVRYGGDEFLIVLPETTFENGEIKAHRLQQMIAQTAMEIENTVIHMTASFGVTGYNDMNRYTELLDEDIIKKCDQLMYLSKREGRNCVRSAHL
jgi:diguanylate cyclase (GGDEF)-like protein